MVTEPATPTPAPGPVAPGRSATAGQAAGEAPGKVQKPHPKPTVHKVAHKLTTKHPVAKPAPHKTHVATPKHKLPTVKVVTHKKP